MPYFQLSQSFIFANNNKALLPFKRRIRVRADINIIALFHRNNIDIVFFTETDFPDAAAFPFALYRNFSNAEIR